jgi:protein SCO1/2
MASFATIGLVAVVIASVGAGVSRAQEPAVAAAPEAAIKVPEIAAQKLPNPFAGRFPNVVLKTHEGKNVRFYDDLLKGKVVLLNFFYATCKER